MKKIFYVLTGVLLISSCTSTRNSSSVSSSSTSEYIPSISEEISAPTIPETGFEVPASVEGLIAEGGDVSAFGEATSIALNDDAEAAAYANYKIVKETTIGYGTVYEINVSGVYVLSGILYHGFISVAKKNLNVTLVLNGVLVYAEHYAAIVCLKKSNVTVYVPSGSVNYVVSGETFTQGYDAEEEANASLNIRQALTITGPETDWGNLVVIGKANNGVGSKGTLALSNVNLCAYGLNNAVKGNDSVVINKGTYTLKAGEDGLKSELKEDEPTYGAITVTDAELNIETYLDGIDAALSLEIDNSSVSVLSGDGASGTAKDTESYSYKGIKSDGYMTITGSVINVDSFDDSIHGAGTVTVTDSALYLNSADDGIHSDTGVVINEGSIVEISNAYEGIEAYDITINGGVIRVKSDDDGINVAGEDPSAVQGSVRYDALPAPGGPGGGFGPGGEESINGKLTINGGILYVNAAGDGLDSNGYIEMNGGFVIVHGPTNSGNAALDYDKTFAMKGGVLVAMGSNGMAQLPGSDSTQKSFMISLSSAKTAGTIFDISFNGTSLLTIASIKNVSNIVYSGPGLTAGSVTIKAGGTYSGTVNSFNVYEGGTYSGGTVLKTFSLSGTNTKVNQ